MISIIVSTYNEEENIAELISRIRQVGLPEQYEIIVVDDSTDNTAKIAREHGARVIKGEHKGLSAAIIQGIKKAQGNKLIIIDTDLQHPPELIPRMARELDNHELVIASRRIRGGGTEGWSFKRGVVSNIANLLALPFAPKVKDRNSGYFGFTPTVVNPTTLEAKGFGMGLQIFTKGHYKSFIEVPYVFTPRERGDSKLSSAQILEYIKLLISLLGWLSYRRRLKNEGKR